MTARTPEVQTVDEWRRDMGRTVAWLIGMAVVVVVLLATGVIA